MIYYKATYFIAICVLIGGALSAPHRRIARNSFGRICANGKCYELPAPLTTESKAAGVQPNSGVTSVSQLTSGGTVGTTGVVTEPLTTGVLSSGTNVNVPVTATDLSGTGTNVNVPLTATDLSGTTNLNTGGVVQSSGDASIPSNVGTVQAADSAAASDVAAAGSGTTGVITSQTGVSGR